MGRSEPRWAKTGWGEKGYRRCRRIHVGRGTAGEGVHGPLTKAATCMYGRRQGDDVRRRLHGDYDDDDDDEDVVAPALINENASVHLDAFTKRR